MRSIFLILVLANALLFVAQFDAVRDLIWTSKAPARAPALNAERLRIIRDTSTTLRPATPQQAPTPTTGTAG
jgi:hypothetical protein